MLSFFVHSASDVLGSSVPNVFDFTALLIIVTLRRNSESKKFAKYFL